MKDSLIFQVVGAVLVLLLWLARLLPDQKWLDPFRRNKKPRAPFPNAIDALFPPPKSAKQEQNPTRTRSFSWDEQVLRSQQTHRKFTRIKSGIEMMILGVVLLFGYHFVMRITGNDPVAQGLGMFINVLAGGIFILGIIVLFARTPGR